LFFTLGSWTSDSDSTSAAIIALVVGAAAGTATVLTLIASLSFISAVQALIYLDLRVRREGLDLWLRPVLKPPTQPTGPTW
jgi:hypothetical protein